jgi:Tfp pilus assembly ATPase PilU
VVNQLLLPKADGSGYALAAEILNNYEQDFSGAIGDTAKMQSVLERPDRKGSVLLAESVAELVNSGSVNKSDAVRSVVGMANVQEKLRQLLK